MSPFGSQALTRMFSVGSPCGFQAWRRRHLGSCTWWYPLVLLLVLVLALSLALVLVLGGKFRSKDRNVCRKGASLSPNFLRAAHCCRLCREARFGVCVVGCCLLVQR